MKLETRHQFRGLPLDTPAQGAERDEAPAAGTSDEVVDGQVAVPTTAAERGGVQPVAKLTANLRSRAEVSSGAIVLLRLTADTPPRSGEIVTVEWDLDGDGDYDTAEIIQPATQVDLTQTARFTEPGTYLITARVTTQGEAKASSPWARVENLPRARIVVN